MQFIEDYILRFPEAWQFKIGEEMDDAVKAFAFANKETLDSVKRGTAGIVNSVEDILNFIPWVVLVLAIVLLSRLLIGTWRQGLIFGAMLVFIGCCGLWENMTETLSVVIVSVALCILLGFPLGVVLAMSKKANHILRPALDTMQTMPSWVYLVPAVMLFKTGITPALLATVIYSIVPMIRMTSHGLLYVDGEMMEASRAFGATGLQTLIKIQIPQAKPTIMTGVNQTIMMAMAMVVTCALIGANGLGMEILVAVNRVQMGKSLLPGIAIVILAVILDRLTQAIVKKSEVKADG